MPAILEHLPKKYGNYYEPFVGGGAVLFNLQPQQAVINDSNAELINVYQVIKNNLEELLEDLRTHKNEEDYFYKLRSLDRNNDFQQISDVKRASRIIYLNKTCFNGLYRVNSAGEFNSPFGRYTNPNIVNEITLRAVNKYLNSNEITIFSGDYSEVLTGIKKEAFVYFDPPYHPISASSNFTGYTQGGFRTLDQVALKGFCDKLNEDGVFFLLSNSASDFIKDLYSNYKITLIKATRAINSNGEKRGEIDEVLICNYE